MDPALPEPSPAAPAPAPDLTDAGVPGRTRPRFEELPPGPPAWPGWLACGLGLFGLGYVTTVTAAAGGSALSIDVAIAALVAGLGGAVLLTAGLIWLPLAGILQRRVLPASRYRGGSVLALFLLALVGGTLVSLPVLLLLIHGDPEQLVHPSTGVVTVELLVTPLTLLTIFGGFVLLPRALQGLRLWEGARSVVQLVVGAGLGIVTWFGIGLISAALEAFLQRLGIQLGGQQEVAGLATDVGPLVAIPMVVVLAPIAEELFFRGLVFNAWEREYGTRRAIVGSALLFALAHLIGGTPAAVAIVFVLGLVLALVYARTRTLATTIGLHACFNLATLVVLFLAPQ